MRIAIITIVSAAAVAFASVEAQAACATGFAEILDIRGKARCVAADALRTRELQQRQDLDLRTLQDGQKQVLATQRTLKRALADEQIRRQNAVQSDQRRREIDRRQ